MRYSNEFVQHGLETKHTTGSSEETASQYDLDSSYFCTFAKAPGRMETAQTAKLQ